MESEWKVAPSALAIEKHLSLTFLSHFNARSCFTSFLSDSILDKSHPYQTVRVEEARN